MSIYKMIETKNGMKYWKDSRFVKKADIPENILAVLTPHEDIDDQHLPEIAIDKSCVFCGMNSKYSRVINGQTVYICEMDYYDKTTGQILAQYNLQREGQPA